MNYDSYNREERAICSHLFRLLNDGLANNQKESGLYKFLEVLSKKGVTFQNTQTSFDVSRMRFNNIGVFPEVAIIRDKFEELKPDVNDFMDNLVKIVQRQEKEDSCLFSQLPQDLRNTKRTNPQHILRKSLKTGQLQRDGDIKVYGEVQAMFNAKPDLVVTIDDFLFVFEAKFTEGFVESQMQRTRNIAEVWATLLYEDLGYKSPPAYTILKIGAPRYKPDISWLEIAEIAQKHYPKNDRTHIAFNNAIELLNNSHHKDTAK